MLKAYQRKVHRRLSAPVIRVYASGHIALSMAAHELLGSPRYVELYVDKTDGRIALKSTDEKRLDTYTVSTWERGGAVFAARSFVADILGAYELPLRLRAELDGDKLAASLPKLLERTA